MPGPGEAAESRLTSAVCQTMRAAITAAGGNEVFFVLKRSSADGTAGACFDEVKVLARGHQSAVPAALRDGGEWEFAIHNHPSGRLEPSEADLSVASLLSRRGIGSAIVDNRLESIYVVVEAVREAPRVTLNPDEIDKLLGPQGPIAAAHAGYEDRPGQRAMARLVCTALNDDQVVAVEAGTGTGKSLAYLVPALLWAVQNDEKVVISTHTILLQRQLVEKDIPFVLAALGLEARVELVTGRNNYACKRRVEEAAKAEESFFDDDAEKKMVAELVGWARRSRNGHRGELSIPPNGKAWERVASATDKSLKSQCPHFAECFYYRARRSADKAHILVVNHHLLLSDLAIKAQRANFDDASVLPPYKRLVLDEAHHLEDVAAKHLGAQVSRRGIRMLLGRLHSHSRGERGLLPFALKRLAKEGEKALAREVEEDLMQKLSLEDQGVEFAFDAVRELALQGKEPSSTEIIDFGEPRPWAEIFSEFEGAAQRLEILGKEVHQFASRLSKVGDGWVGTALELQAVGMRLKATGLNLQMLVGREREGLTRWLEIAPVRRDKQGREHHEIKLVSSPLDIAGLLGETLFRHTSSVVLTSATLAVEGSFDFLTRRVGLPEKRSQNLMVASPFDYAQNCTLAMPTDYPAPNDARFTDWLPRAVLVAARASRGRMFVLFTSHWLLRQTAKKVRESLWREGYNLLVQGERSRRELLRMFSSLDAPVLFGTDSFWEGVDMPGSQLVQVVIPRLPFRVPDHPVEAGRLRAIRDAGGNPFREYSLPCAVLKLKQGFGRLIRSRRDTGAVVVLDPRLRTRWYGRSFLDSLPEPRQLRDAMRPLLANLAETVFADEEEPSPPTPRAAPSA